MADFGHSRKAAAAHSIAFFEAGQGGVHFVEPAALARGRGFVLEGREIEVVRLGEVTCTSFYPVNGLIRMDPLCIDLLNGKVPIIEA